MSLKNAIGGIALIAGTAIGAAVLALPVATAHMGFIQTVVNYVICWFFMTMGALYLLEANLFVGFGTNLISMAEITLGKFGKYFTWIIYLILLYALTAAYLSGAGAWITQLNPFHLELPPLGSAIIATILTLSVIILGTTVTDWVNRFLMIGLIASFATLLFAVSSHIQVPMLFENQRIFDFRPLPLIITAFGSAIVIPTVTEYLHGKPRQLLSVVLIGSLIPLLVYVVWEIGILGTIPLEGMPGLLQIQEYGHPVTDIPKALEFLLGNTWVTKASSYFSIFALTTSLLGVTLSLFDFLADGFHLFKKNKKGKAILSAITFIPPLIFIIYFPLGFIIALSFAGVFVAILLGILPAMMVWQGRYRLHLPSALQIKGGKALLILTILFFLCVTIIEIFNQYEIFWGAV